MESQGSSNCFDKLFVHLFFYSPSFITYPPRNMYIPHYKYEPFIIIVVSKRENNAKKTKKRESHVCTSDIMRLFRHKMPNKGVQKHGSIYRIIKSAGRGGTKQKKIK